MDDAAPRAEPENGYGEAVARRLALDHADLRRGLRPPSSPKPLPEAGERARALAARVRRDLEVLNYPRDAWVLPRRHPAGHHVHDVAIVGGGQGGLAVAFALRRERVGNVVVLERAPSGREGPWDTYSRMWTLRSPKHVTGPDLGIPSLAPRTWFEAVFGADEWERLGKWPRQAWQAYLDWYRDTLGLPVRNGVDVTSFHDEAGLVRLEVREGAAVYARKVVLATGIEGHGDWYVPPFIKDKLSKDAWSTCGEDVDSLAWKGRRIAMLGAGATAWDRAADLLELGAGSVTIYMRRRQILVANPFRYLEKAGYLRHYASMSDADKWRWMQAVFVFGQPPTQDGVDRCAAFDNFVLHPGATWTDVGQTAGGIEVVASDGSVERFDHLFIGCGFSMDARNRPELAPLADNIATWNDKFAIPPDQPDPWLATYPYLNRDLSFVEKVPGLTPVLANLHCFTYGATLTNAHSGASLTGMRYGIEPLIHGLTHALWMADEPAHFARLKSWSDIDTNPAALERRLWRRNGG